MAKQKYRLQPIVILRTRLKKKAEIELAAAIRKLKEEKGKLKKLEEQLKQIIKKWKQKREEMRRQMETGAMIGEGNVYVRYLKKLKEDEEKKKEEIEGQKKAIADAETGVSKARRNYIDACKSLQIMERHKELWEKKLRDEITRREENEMDELGRTLYALQRWRGEKPIFEAR